MKIHKKLKFSQLILIIKIILIIFIFFRIIITSTSIRLHYR